MNEHEHHHDSAAVAPPPSHPHAGHDRMDGRSTASTDGHTGQMDHAGQVMAMGHGGHAGHAMHNGHGDHAAIFRARFWISLILSVPVVLFSPMVQDWLGYSLPPFPGDNLIAPVIGTIVFLYGGRVFLEGGWSEIRTRQPGMMLLISLALVVAFVASLASSLGLFHLEFWWELALLVTIMLLGHWQEMRAIGQAQGALSALAALLPDEAERITDGATETVPVSDLKAGDIVLVRPGARVPADGTIASGQAEFDESMITGESQPVARGEGDRVVAGTVAAGSAVRVRVEATGDETVLAGIQRLVEEAQQSKSRAQALADRFAAALFFIAVGAGLITFLVWLGLGRIDDAVTRTVTVLVISCPHALGLAIPLVIAISTAISAKQGILIKDRLALERMRKVDTILFDKTGTLTLGNHAVTNIAAVDGNTNRLLALAASVEADSEHPLARAIVTKAHDERLAIPRAADFTASAGRGVQATVDGATVAVGGPAMFREQHLTVPESLVAQTGPWSERGAAVLHVVRDGQIIGALALEDQVRPESKEAVAELHAQGIRVVMITGDAKPVAEAIGRELGIDEVLAEVLPEDKERKLAGLQQQGHVVAMVGDGVNDAPALARADVGIAIGAGTDVAIESAGVILATSDPRAVVSVRKLSNASYRKMLANLGWAAGYNLVTIPLAAGILAPIGFTLAPAVGAVLMSLSTIVVALNAQLLRRLDLRPGAA